MTRGLRRSRALAQDGFTSPPDMAKGQGCGVAAKAVATGATATTHLGLVTGEGLGGEPFEFCRPGPRGAGRQKEKRAEPVFQSCGPLPPVGRDRVGGSW